MNKKANLGKAVPTEISIESQSLGTALRAIEQPKKPLVRVRVRDGCLEFVCLDDLCVVLAVARIPLEGSVDDSAEFSVDRASLEHLAARSDGSVQMRSDEEMAAFRGGDHIYSSVSLAESEDLTVWSRTNAARMELDAGQLQRLTNQIDAPRVVFTAAGGDLWLSGTSMSGDQHGGPVRVPRELVTAADSDCRTVVSEKYLTRCMRQLPLHSDCTVRIGTDEPLWICASTDRVDTRHVIAPRISEDIEVETEVRV